MIKLIFGVFIMLHGLVHLLYFGQCRRMFELQPGMVWPDGSWALSRFLDVEATRAMAGGLLILAAVGFVAGGMGLLLNQSWGPAVVVGSAVFSTAVYILLWDGAAQSLADKGGVGILINAALVAALYWISF